MYNITAYNFLLYFHTIKYLKIKQVIWRIWYKIRPNPYLKNNKFQKRETCGKWIQPILKSQSLFGKNKFFFLNQVGELDQIGWQGIQKSKLWRYNQHYFDDLNSIDANLRIDWHINLVNHWIKSNPIIKKNISVGWDPYPTSLRSVNLIKWVISGGVLTKEIEKTLVQHGHWLCKKIEWQIMGNHLFANAKALIFMGCFMKGRFADYWLAKGVKILRAQLTEQILEDGGHFERSPMYHCIILEDILDIINLTQRHKNIFTLEFKKELTKSAEKMLSCIKDLTHPDGQISFFNDSSFGVAAIPCKIFNYANDLSVKYEKRAQNKNSITVTKYISSGYVRLDTATAVTIMDVGSVGPSYQPGHAHAGTLSFELSIKKARIIVNSGISCYEDSWVRKEERSTSAHSTVEVNGHNSSEVWSSFRVARRAKIIDLEIRKEPKSSIIECSHDGYHRLNGSVTHSRTLSVSENEVQVVDNLTGHFVKAVAHFHIHPAVQIQYLSDTHYLLHVPGIKSEINFIINEGKSSIKKSFFSSEFGNRAESKKICVNFINPYSSITIKW